MTISNWKEMRKGSLVGFFTVTTPSGMVIHGCSLFEKEGKRWVSMPSRIIDKPDGTKLYKAHVEFVSKEISQKFQDAVLKALDSEGDQSY